MGNTPNADRISAAMLDRRRDRSIRAAPGSGGIRKKKLIVISDSEDEDGAGDGVDDDVEEDGDFEVKKVDIESSDDGSGDDKVDDAESAVSLEPDERPSKRRKITIGSSKVKKSTKPTKTSSSSTISGSKASTSTDRKHSSSHHSTNPLSTSAPLLLDWFSTVHTTRGMPWRKPYDPSLSQEEKGKRAYEVWVSEVMLQQTQVATVIPYWKRWMERWPGVEDLAKADVEEVNSAWRGLGYYRRARSLLEGAKKIMDNSSPRIGPSTSADGSINPEANEETASGSSIPDMKVDEAQDIADAIDLTAVEDVDLTVKKSKTAPKPRGRVRSKLKEAEPALDFLGRLPNDVGMMEKHIPGVGRYTAGAICSIAYGKRVPIVDGNINRLLSRVLAIHLPSDSPALAKQLWVATTELLDSTPCLQEEGRAGDWNQALMELGSQVCKPVGPDCGKCCLRSVCKAYEETTSLPPIPNGQACATCEPFTTSDLNATESSVSEVTIYPMKKASAKGPREESTAVCVLKWIPSGAGGEEKDERWLFVKRPEKGLLAGLFEPPSVALSDPDATGPDRLAQCKTYLKEDLLQDIDDSTEIPSTGKGRLALRSGNYLGEYLHIFSHIRMTYHVHLHTLQGPPGVTSPPAICSDASNDGRVVWLTKEEVGKANVGTGVKRIWDMIYGKQSVWAGEVVETEEKRVAKKGAGKRMAKVKNELVTKVEVTTTTVRKTVRMPGMKVA